MDLQNTLQTLRRKAFPKRYALETELSGLREEHARVEHELEDLRETLAQTREQDARQLSELQLQLESVAGERQSAQAQVQQLESSLAEAALRQQGAEQQIHTLESRLDEMRSQREASLGLAEESLTRLQAEQQNLLTLQTDLAKTFHGVGKQLLEAVQRAAQPRMSRLQGATLAALLFACGALLSGLMLRTDHPAIDITPLHTGILELQQLMQAHFESHDALLQLLTENLGREQAQREQSGSTDALAGRLLERQRADLAVLGFTSQDEVGQVLARFQAFYLPAIEGEPAATPEEVDAVLGYYVDLARKDSRKYRLDTDILAAIRLASKRTGVEFSFLMELAATESSFNPAARASTSTAVGLYQFKEDTWLDAVSNYGERYGLARYSSRIEHTPDAAGVMQPTISDRTLLAEVLDLRLDARYSALLAAEHIRANGRHLSSRLERKPDRTDLYLTHFFGATGAISFLKALAEEPGRIAGELFPGPAKRNRNIFQGKASRQRTLAEIYNLFARKFNTSRFRDAEPG